MATDSSTTLTDAELLYQYLGRRLANGGREESVGQLMIEFSEYLHELAQVRGLLQEALDSSARGESKPLDLEALFARADKRLKERGVSE